jgi:RNA polymerase sigma factor (sigma-70 family)
MDVVADQAPAPATAATDDGFDRFFREHSERLGRAMYLLTGDRWEAENLAQEALVRTFERWTRVRGMDSPGGYLYRVAFNLNRKRLRRLLLELKQRVAPTAVSEPEHVVERRMEVLAALSALTRRQREAIVLVGWLGFPAEEAGEVLGLKPTSVRGLLHRARAKLREELGVHD